MKWRTPILHVFLIYPTKILAEELLLQYLIFFKFKISFENIKAKRMPIMKSRLKYWILAEINFVKYFVHKGKFFVQKFYFSSWTALQISIPWSKFFYGSEVEGLNNVAFKWWHPKSNEDEDSVWTKNWEKNTSRSSVYCFVLSKPVMILY